MLGRAGGILDRHLPGAGPWRSPRARVGASLNTAATPMLVAGGHGAIPGRPMVTALSRDVWVDPADFRTLGELHVTGTLVLLGDPRRRLAVPAIALSAGWLTTAAFRALIV
jgi:hypothetical protein